MNAASNPPATTRQPSPISHHGHRRPPLVTGASGGGTSAPGCPGTLVASVLTFILVVVLGGGVGLLVVSLAESSEPATDAGRSGRGDAPVEPAPVALPDSDPEPVPGPRAAPGPQLVEAPEPALDPASEPIDPPAPLLVGAPPTTVDVEGSEAEPDPPPPRPRHQRDVLEGPVPSTRTAVEGRYDEVASAPLWRRVMAVLGIVVITVTTGVVIAAILGAIIAAGAEVLGNTIG